MIMTVFELLLMAFVVGTALLIPILDDIVSAIVAFGVVALGVSVLWVLLAAPDIALIEAAVGAGVVSLLFMLTLVKTTGIEIAGNKIGTDDETDDPAATDGGAAESVESDSTTGDAGTGVAGSSFTLRTLGVIAAIGIPLVYIVSTLDPVGAPDAPGVTPEFNGELTPYGYYIEETVADTGFTNAVVAVLVVYRGVDTLGELIVAFAAAVSILIVLGRSDLV